MITRKLFLDLLSPGPVLISDIVVVHVDTLHIAIAAGIDGLPRVKSHPARAIAVWLCGDGDLPHYFTADMDDAQTLMTWVATRRPEHFLFLPNTLFATAAIQALHLDGGGGIQVHVRGIDLPWYFPANPQAMAALRAWTGGEETRPSRALA